MPYLYAAAVDATRSGLPVLRAMILEFESDPACEYLDRQYMLGGSLLVAPIFSPDGDVSFYLPQGTWTSLLTGETVQGSAWRHERHGYLSLPLHVRPGSLIALGNVDGRPDYDYASGVELHLFALPDGAQTAATVYGPTGEEELQVTCAQQGNRITIEATGAGKPWTLVLRGISSVTAVRGAAYEPRTDGVKIVPQAGVSRIEIDV
jgi:alpha-D-xyloside xylohydrolase